VFDYIPFPSQNIQICSSIIIVQRNLYTFENDERCRKVCAGHIALSLVNSSVCCTVVLDICGSSDGTCLCSPILSVEF